MSIARFASVVVALATLVLLAPVATPPAHALSKALRCAFAKQRAAVKKTDMLLACQREALKRQVPVDPACVARVLDRLERTFELIEAQGGCKPVGDLPQVEQAVDQCATRLGQLLQGVCGENGDTCSGGNAPCCPGLVCSGPIGGTPTCHP